MTEGGTDASGQDGSIDNIEDAFDNDFLSLAEENDEKADDVPKPVLVEDADDFIVTT